MNRISAEIKNRLSLQNVVIFYTGQEPKKNKICCPFHNEKTPSFSLFPNNTYYCFGCGESGTVIDFVMKLFNLDFKGATERIDNDFHLCLFEKPTLTKRRQMDRLLKEQELKRQEELKQRHEVFQRYWNAFDDVFLLEKIIENFKPESPDDVPCPMFLYGLQNIEFARYSLNCAEDERRQAVD